VPVCLTYRKSFILVGLFGGQGVNRTLDTKNTSLRITVLARNPLTSWPLRIRSGARKILSPFAEIREHLRNLLSRSANQIESPPEHQGENVLCWFDGKLAYRKRRQFWASFEKLGGSRGTEGSNPPLSASESSMPRDSA
jgi:hypothetical protein